MAGASHSGAGTGTLGGRREGWCGERRRGLTVSVVLLAERLRGRLAVAVLLTPVVLLLAQVLLGRACGRAGCE